MVLTRVRLLLRLRFIQTLLQSGLGFIFGRNGRVSIFRGTRLNCKSEKPFLIKPKGNLFLNRSWTGLHPFRFFLTMEEGSLISCDGTFSFYEGGIIGISKGATLSLGSGYANSNITISCRVGIRIGHDVAIGPNAVIRDSDDHRILDGKDERPVHQRVSIGDNVWIGTNVVILKGVTIGNGCVIAAGSVVSRSIPAGSLAAGVPARVIKSGIRWE